MICLECHTQKLLKLLRRYALILIYQICKQLTSDNWKTEKSAVVGYVHQSNNHLYCVTAVLLPCQPADSHKNVHDVNAKLVQVFVLSRVLHTEVRWLSKGNMLGRLFELRDEVMKKPGVHVALAYLSDIFESLNTLSLKLQGGESNNFSSRCHQSVTDKFQLWKRKILACNYSCFPRLFGILEEARFQNDFKDTDTKNPFHVDMGVLPDRLQEEVVEIKNDSEAKYDFEKIDKPLFWVKYLTVYPSTAEQALKLYLSFSSTYLCERAFSAVVAIKNKLRSKLSIANDLRCAVSTIQPRIQNLVKNMQAHPSH
ncbi:SCAN domain-containing protein 3-like [Schistocerca piceifrons]|uniref:SCAN domain-containing protein 3-like n=1 Tax=Schistocerca piceifrons TaxID=274613 RepID=UPI001F5F7552|nr:SCAN domain-containing protein 3-like [Schistocerca piceifrons]